MSRFVYYDAQRVPISLTYHSIVNPHMKSDTDAIAYPDNFVIKLIKVCFRIQHQDTRVQRVEAELLGRRRAEESSLVLAQLLRADRRRHLGGGLDGCSAHGRLPLRTARIAQPRSAAGRFAAHHVQ